MSGIRQEDPVGTGSDRLSVNILKLNQFNYPSPREDLHSSGEICNFK